jgi:hypothetical protein
MRRLTLLCALLLAVASGASASGETPAPPVAAEDEAFERSATAATMLTNAVGPFPAAVQRILDEGRRDCLAEGGTALRYGPGIVRTADLNGDRRPDYVIDFRESRCEERPAMFNGTGGWDLVILIGQPGGQTREVFNGRVRDYTILGGRGPRRITFDLHGSYCGLAGVEPCPKTRTITSRPFEFRDR